jgi:phage-related protein
VANSVELATGYISLAVSTKGLGSQVAREFTGVERQADKSGKSAGKRLGAHIGGGISSGIKAGGAALAGLVAGREIVGFLKDANAEARDSQKVGARTTAIIKATGGAAKVSSTQVGDLATSISNKAGVDDEAIQSGANLLLTFKNVRNEAGKGGKIFDRATQAATDLSAAGFGSITSASKQLGKALNDPVKGLSSLSRAGVQFTKQQKAQVTALVQGGDAQAAAAMGLVDSAGDYNALLKINKGDSKKTYDQVTKDLTKAQKKQFEFYSEGGHQLEAQKIVLKEVEGQVGGVAAASATAGEKLSVAFGNFKEQIGTALLPVIDKVAGVLTKRVVPAMSGFVTGMTTGTGAGGKFVGFLKSAGSALATVGGFIARNRDVLIPLVGAVVAGVAAFKVITGVVKAFTAVQAALNFVMSANPIGLVVVAIGALVVGLIYAYKHSKTFRDIVNSAFTGIKKVAGAVLRWLTKAVKVAIDFVRKHWKTMAAILGGPIGIAVRLITKHWGSIKRAFTSALSWVKGAFRKGWNLVKPLLGGPVFAAFQLIRKHWGSIRAAFTSALNWVKSKFKAGWALLKGFITKPVSDARSTLSKLLGKGGTIRTLFSNAVSAIGRIWGGLKRLAKAPIRFIVNTVLENGLLHAFRTVAGLVGFNTDKFHVSLPKGFRTGGYTGRKRPDEVAGLVHGDEHVIKSPSRRKAELQLPGGLDYLNRTGKWPVGPAAEVEGAKVNAKRGQAAPVNMAGIPDNLKKVIRRGPRPGDRSGYGSPLSFGTSHVGDMGWYNRCLAFVNAAWNFTVPRFRLGTARQSMNAGPREMKGRPPAGAGVYWDTGPSGHIALAAGDGTVFSNDIRKAGRIDRVPQQEINKWGPYRGWWSPNGSKGAAGFDPGGSSSGGGLAAVVDYVAKLRKKFTGPLAQMKTLGDSPFVGMAKGIPTKVASLLLKKAKGFVGSAVGKAIDVAKGVGLKGYAAALMPSHGWNPLTQLGPLIKLWNGESGWRVNAANPSGAYGIPQALPGSKMASAGSDWRTSGRTQIRWGEDYIKGRYGSPAKAWSFWQRQSPHWYGAGTTNARPGLNYVGEHGPELVMSKQLRAFRGGETVLNANRTAAALGGTPPVVINGGVHGYTAREVAKEIVKEQRQAEALRPVMA